MSARSQQLDSMDERTFCRLLGCVGAMPLISYLFLLFFAGLVFRATGHWPTYGSPDPKSVSIAAVAPIVWITIAASAFATPIYAIVFSLHALHRRLRLSTADRFGLVACATGVALWATTSGQMLNWFLD